MKTGLVGDMLTEVLCERRFRLLFRCGVKTSRSNGSMWLSRESQTCWIL